MQSVLDRQLTNILFAAETPIILTGDDNGVINVYKLFKITGHVEGISAGLKTRLADPAWVEQQGQTLQNVLNSKITGLSS